MAWSPLLWPSEFFSLDTITVLVEPSWYFVTLETVLWLLQELSWVYLSENELPSLPWFLLTILGDSRYSITRFVIIWIKQNLDTQILFFIAANLFIKTVSPSPSCRTVVQAWLPGCPWWKRMTNQLADSVTCGERFNFLLAGIHLNIVLHTFLLWKSAGFPSLRL